MIVDLNIIWIIIYVLLLFINILINHFFYKRMNPVTLFCLIWSVVGICANLSLYDFYLPSFFVNITICSAIIISQIIYLIIISNRNMKFNNKFEFKKFRINYLIILIAAFITSVILLPMLVKSISYLLTNGWSNLRSNYDSFIPNGIYAVLINSYIRPMYGALAILSIVNLFTNNSKKSKIFLLVVGLVVNLEMVFLTAGRIYLVNYLFYFLISTIIFYKEGKLNLSVIMKKCFPIIIVLLLLLITITSDRNLSNNDKTNFFYNFYTYYFSGPTYLTQLLNNPNIEYGVNGKLLYGSASFGFITNIFSHFIIYITGKPSGSLYIVSSLIASKQYFIGGHTYINAMFTVFYPFIVDFGYLGIIMCPLYISVFSYVITKKFYTNNTIFDSCIYIYWINVLIRSVFKWELLNVDFLIIIIFLKIVVQDSTLKRCKL